MRKIVIIGATSGIGKTLAELYAKTDAEIAIVGRREDKLQEIALTYKDKCIYRVCDINITDILTGTLDDIFNQLGGIDLMIISAGTGELNPELVYPLEEPTLKTNVLGWTCIVDWTINNLKSKDLDIWCLLVLLVAYVAVVSLQLIMPLKHFRLII